MITKWWRISEKYWEAKSINQLFQKPHRRNCHEHTRVDFQRYETPPIKLILSQRLLGNRRSTSGVATQLKCEHQLSLATVLRSIVSWLPVVNWISRLVGGCNGLATNNGIIQTAVLSTTPVQRANFKIRLRFGTDQIIQFHLETWERRETIGILC